MAGRARLRAVHACLTTWAHADIGEDATAYDWVVDEVTSGAKLLDICRKLEMACGYEVKTALLHKAMEKDGKTTAEVDMALSDARKRGASVKVEEAEDLADGLGRLASREEIAAAKLKAEVRQWSASRHDRARYGTDRGNAVEINIGELHLQAIQEQPARPSLTSAASEAEIAAVTDAEVISIEEAEDIELRELLA